MFSQCLGCYQLLGDESITIGYHKRCSRKIFESDLPPVAEFGQDELEKLARQAINQHLGITGVQPKISISMEKRKSDTFHRMVIVGAWGNFILKPAPERFPELPAIEDVTMHMAQAAGIQTAAHGLIPLKSGTLAYISRRFDRKKEKRAIKQAHRTSKVSVEDFCQLSGLLTERKYKSSMEKAGKVILKYSSNPGLDVVTFFDLAIFSFLTGNADMHLKNFSLITHDNGEVGFAPAYDLVCTRILPLDDAEEMALTVNGKKSKLTRKDFEVFGEALKIPKKVREKSFERLSESRPAFVSLLLSSFLSEGLKAQYLRLVEERARTLKF